MGTIPASENVFPLVELAEVAAPATPATGQVRLYAKSDGLLYSKDDAGTETAVGVTAHLADTADAHDASAISIADAGTLYTATDVEAALAEVMAAVGAGGIPATIFDAQGDLIVASAADTAARLAVGATGTVLVGGTSPSWGKGNPVKDFATTKYTAGDITCDADSVWEALGISDLTLTAVSGDVIEVGLSLVATSTTAVSINFDVVTIVSAAPVNSIASGATPSDSNDGVSGWRVPGSVHSNVSGSILYALQAGDISGGTVTLQVRDRPASSTNRVVDATAARPIHFWAKNLGQQL